MGNSRVQFGDANDIDVRSKHLDRNCVHAQSSPCEMHRWGVVIMISISSYWLYDFDCARTAAIVTVLNDVRCAIGAYNYKVWVWLSIASELKGSNLTCLFLSTTKTITTTTTKIRFSLHHIPMQINRNFREKKNHVDFPSEKKMCFSEGYFSFWIISLSPCSRGIFQLLS